MGWEHWAIVSQKNNRALRKDRSKYFRDKNRIVSRKGERLKTEASPEQLLEIRNRMLAWNRIKIKKKVKALLLACIVTGLFLLLFYQFVVYFLL